MSQENVLAARMPNWRNNNKLVSNAQTEEKQYKYKEFVEVDPLLVGSEGEGRRNVFNLDLQNGSPIKLFYFTTHKKIHYTATYLSSKVGMLSLAFYDT